MSGATLYSVNQRDAELSEQVGSALRDKKLFIIEESARALSGQSKFYEAASLLEDLDEIAESSELGVKLLLAECYMQLGRESKANKAIKDVKRIINAHASNADGVLDLADDFASTHSSVVRALILIRIACDMYCSGSDPNAILDGVARCISKSEDVISLMAKSDDESDLKKQLKDIVKGLGNIALKDNLIDSPKLDDSSKETPANAARMRVMALDFGIEYMLEMLEVAQNVKAANPEKKALKIAFCTNMIGYEYVLFDQPSKGVKVRELGARALEDQFGLTVSRYRLYGILLHNIGVGYYNLHRFGEAKLTYEKAIRAKENAIDYDNENDKRIDIERSRKDLKDTHKVIAHLGL